MIPKEGKNKNMNNEKILYYLGILENGALNYYQTVETIRVASQSIQNYIEQLEQQCKKQKEVIDKAVLELANIDGNLSNSQLSDRICNLIDILEGEDKEVLE